MKKYILILLLFTGFIQAQTYPTNPTAFGKVAIKNNSVSTSTTKINTQEADGQVNYIDAVNLPVPASVTNALDVKTTNSAGAIQGFAITNNGDGTVNIASGTAYLRATNDQYAQLVKYTIPAVTNLSLTDNTNNFVLVDYNGGVPALTVTTNSATINTETNSLMSVISRVGTTLDYVSLVGQNNDANAKIRIRFLNQEGIRRANGAVIGFANRNLTLTAGTLFSGLIRINSPAFNTASPDTFTYVYNNGSVWTRVTAQTQVNNTQYNNAGTLTTMSNNDFRTDYVYLLPNNPSKLYVVYGNTTYNSITLARTAPVPSSLPSELQVLGLLVGRQIIQKNAVVISEVSSAFSDVFTGVGVPEHNALAGLQGGTTNDYQHLTTSQLGLVNSALQGTGTNGQVAFWTGTNTQTGDNSLFWDNTNKRLGFGTVSPGVVIDATGTTFASTQFRSTAISNTDNSVITLRRALAGTTAVTNATVLGSIGFRGHDGTSYGSTNTASIDIYASETFTTSAKGSSISFNVTPKLSTTAINPFNIFGTSVNVDYNFSNPTNVQSGFYSTVLGKGDNATYKGIAAINGLAKDRPDVTGSNKGVLIGVQATVFPIVSRNNVPFDDVNGVVVNNDGTGKATDAIYLSKNTTNFPSTSQWSTLFTSDANTDFGIRLMGTHTTEYLNFGNKFKIDNNGLTTITANINPTTNNAVALGTDTFNYSAVRSNLFTSNTSLTFDTPNNNSIAFNQGGTQKMRLFNTGNLVIQNGGTFTDNTVDRLQITGTASGTVDATLSNQFPRKGQLDLKADKTYVDGLDANNVKTLGNQTISGNKAFTGSSGNSAGMVTVSGGNSVFPLFASYSNTAGSAIKASQTASGTGNNYEGYDDATLNYYVAKNGTVNGVKIYNSLITQSSTGAPTVTVLGYNQIGTIVWTRTAIGTYVGTLSGAFTASKTMCYINNTVLGSITFKQTSANTVEITTSDLTGSLLDGRLTANSIKIEVYP